MKKYISPMIEIRTLLNIDIVTESDPTTDGVTVFFEDNWSNRFGS